MEQVKKQPKYYDLFSKLFLFRGVEEELVRRAFDDPGCQCAEFAPGEKIYTRKNFRRSLGLVLSGGVEALKEPEGGRIVLNTFTEGGIFGAASLFTVGGYVGEIEAVRRSRILWIPQETLQRFFRLDALIAENYIAYLSGRICFLNSRIDHFTAGSAKGRLSAFLWNLADARPEGGKSFSLDYGMTQLSEMLGIGRTSLYRAFQELEEDGIIIRKGKHITMAGTHEIRKEGI